MSRKRQNGEGSIYQRSNGSWAAVYTNGVKPDGKPNRKWIYGKTAAEVREKLNKVTAQLREGTYIEPEKLTVSAWLTIWLENYVRRPGAKESTGDEYERVAVNRIIPYLGGNKLQKLRPEQLQKWINELSGKYSPASVRNAHRVLSIALKQAIKNRLILFNPAQEAILPKMDSKIKNPAQPLSEAEQEQLLKALPDTTAGRVLAFLIYTGLREGECCALTWANVSKDAISVRQTVLRIKNRGEGTNKTVRRFDTPKTDTSIRDIPLTPSAQAIITKQRTTQAEAALKTGQPMPEFVFATATGNVLEGAYLTKTLYNVCKRIGIPRRSPHDLRHTFGTRLNERGVDANTIARLMGHSNPTTTMNIYIHTDDAQLRRAMDRLEACE